MITQTELKDFREQVNQCINILETLELALDKSGLCWAAEQIERAIAELREVQIEAEEPSLREINAWHQIRCEDNGLMFMSIVEGGLYDQASGYPGR